MMDYTTGFLKVRDYVGAAMREDLWRLSEHHPADEYADFSLTLGLTDSSCYAIPLSFQAITAQRTCMLSVLPAPASPRSWKNLIAQDITCKMGLCVIDPHGDLVYDMVALLGKRSTESVMLDLADTEHMLAYNPLERREGVLVAEQVAKLILAFKRIWADSVWRRMSSMRAPQLSAQMRLKARMSFATCSATSTPSRRSSGLYASTCSVSAKSNITVSALRFPSSATMS